MVSLCGRNYKLAAFLLFAFVFCLYLDLSAARSRLQGRRFRCIPKLCRTCKRYIHSRWRRSLEDTEVELEDAQDALIDQNIFGIPPSLRMSKIDQNLKLGSDIDVELRNYEELSTYRKKEPRIQKRSTMSHLRRCRKLLHTPCCILYGSMVTFIGH